MSGHETRTARRWLGGASLACLIALPAAAQQQQPGQGGGLREVELDEPTARLEPVPDWSIREEVDRLDGSMREYNSLISSLSEASEELGAEYEAYLEDPNNEVLASGVERRLAEYAREVMADFDDIIADQDVLGANFRELRRKLMGFSTHLDGQAQLYLQRLDGFRGNARGIEQRLTELSVRIKEDPPEDPNELRLLRREFAREFRRYRLQTRYVNGYQRRFENYQSLRRNMERLADLFVNLHDRFNELVENLENERQYLEDSLRLQADTLRIKQVIRDGIMGSENAIGNVASKLEDLYDKVGAFTQVHERINANLDNFVSNQGELVDLMRRIDSIGTVGGDLGALNDDMDLAIEAFYDRRYADPEAELLGVEDPDGMQALEEQEVPGE